MRTCHKATIQSGLDWATSHIQNIETSSQDLYQKQQHIEWQLIMLLDDVVLALPTAMRQQAQACIEVKRQIQKTLLADIDARLAELRTQKETSPKCLPASDSF